MLPLTHVAFAFLCYVVVAAVRPYPLRASWALPPLLVGSLLPDLVDKPLAYYDVVAYGRSFAHSLFTFTGACLVLWVTAYLLRDTWFGRGWREHPRKVTPLAFTVGYGSHLVGDVLTVILSGRPLDKRFLVWPIYRIPSNGSDSIAPWLRLYRIYGAMEAIPHLELFVAAGAIFGLIRVGVFIRRRWG